MRATPKPISTNVTTDLVRVCVPIDLGLSADKCQSALAYATEATYKVSYSCIQGNSDYDCIAYVSTGAVDMAKLSGSGIYDGWKLKDLQPVVAEVVDGLPANVDSYSVALIDPTACIGDVKPSLKNLEVRITVKLDPLVINTASSIYIGLTTTLSIKTLYLNTAFVYIYTG